MQAGILNFDPSNREYTYVISLLLFISSIVIADPKSQIDVPDEFNKLTVDAVFERGNKQKKAKDENDRRKTKKDTDQSNVRWGAKSIYEDDENFDPFFSSSENSNDITDIPEATRQIQIKF
ncbi:MAG: hypothetical protein ACR2PU_04980 [Gammaproteobacteria bacterium]